MKEVVVISGKGGTGKTSIVAGLAALGPEKILADCDVDASDLHLVLDPQIQESHEFVSGELARIDQGLCTACGLCRDHCRFDAISEDYQVLQEHCEGCALCYHVCPAGAISMQPRLCGHWFKSKTRFGPLVHARLGIGEENSGKLVTYVRQEANKLGQSQGKELVLVDGSPGVGCPVIASLTNADLALLVAEPTLTAAGDLRRVLDLIVYFGIPGLAVVNKADINPELSQEIEDFCREAGVDMAAKLPYDQNFTLAQIQGKSVTELDPRGLGRIVRGIWEAMADRLYAPADSK
ncbi:MAG: 4Fe-4S binding protein [Desulfohalobiaceae bacterium]